jgi:hypothetical protein
MHKSKKKNKGSITVEAALVIPIFAFAMLSLAFVMRLVYIDETMENSLNHVANNVAQYSYLYKECGMMELVDNADSAMENSAAKAEEHKKVIMEGFPKINEFQTKDVVDSGYVKDITADLNSGGGFEAVMDRVKGDAKKEGLMLLFAIGNEYKSGLGETVYKGITKKMFLMDIDEDKLNKMNLVGGVESLDFTGCDFKKGKDITVVVSYKVKIPFPFIEKKEFAMKNKVRVLSWIGTNE